MTHSKILKRQKTKELFLDPPEDYHFRLLSVVDKLHAPILLPSLLYQCSIQSLNEILRWSKFLTEENFNTIIRGREQMTKYAYEVGTAALLPKSKCAFGACLKKRMELIIQNNDSSTFDRPKLPLQMPPLGIFSLSEGEGKHAEICKSCVRQYGDALKNLRNDFWRNLPTVFNLDKWADVDG